jgi:hypothetical protein
VVLTVSCRRPNRPHVHDSASSKPPQSPRCASYKAHKTRLDFLQHCSNSRVLPSILNTSRQVPTFVDPQDCPFCDKWAETLSSRGGLKGKNVSHPEGSSKVLVSPTRFKRHVATHQEQLAIFAIPRSSESAESPRFSLNICINAAYARLPRRR